MTKPGDKDWLTPEEYRNRIPKKRISGGAIFLDDQNRFLIVKPTYKDYWLLPGGAAEQYESPQAACVREVREELGLTIEPPRLISIVHSARPSKQDDVLYFHFFAKRLPKEQIDNIHLQADELSEMKFVDAVGAQGLMSTGFIEKMPAYLEAINTNHVLYYNELDGKIV